MAGPIAREMAFDGGFLVLGAQTRLAEVGAALDETQLATLLAAAHGRPFEAAAIRHIRRGLEKQLDGDLVLALVHLALSGAAQLGRPREDARRLFLADAPMKIGVQPVVVMKGLGLDMTPSDEALEKYSPDQSRVPAGNSGGGQWTSDDQAEASTSPTPSFASGRPSNAPAAGES